MREIKFRGKNVADRWEYGSYFKHQKTMPCPMGHVEKESDYEHFIVKDGFADWNMPRGIEGVNVMPETVGQFTGLLDKAGREIYEGDVYKISGCWPKYTVVWNCEYAQFCLAAEGATVGVYPVHEQLADMTWLGNLWDKGVDGDA